jgi:hypothetical protein
MGAFTLSDVLPEHPADVTALSEVSFRTLHNERE